MKIIQLLQELNISFEILRSFEKELNCEFLFLDQIVADNVVEEIRTILNASARIAENKKLVISKIRIKHDIDLNKFEKSKFTLHNSDLEKSKTSTKKRRSRSLKILYQSETSFKIEAKVKWYYNYSNDGEYGFLVSNGIPDIYFKGKVVKGIDPKSLRENDEVLVEIRLSDLENTSKVSALKVNTLEGEEDLLFLLHQSIISANEKYFAQTLDQIKIQSKKLKNETKQNIQKEVEVFIKNKLINISQTVFVYKFCELARINLLDEIVDKTKAIFNLQDQLKLWLNTSATFSFNYLKEALVDHLLETNAHSFLNKLDASDTAVALKEALTKSLDSDENCKCSNLTVLLNTIKTFEVEIDYSVFNDNQLFLFWNKNLLNFSPIDTIYKKIVDLWLQDSKTHLDDILEIFDRATEQELKDLFSRAHYNKDFIKNEKEFELIRVFLDHTTSNNLAEEFFKIVYKKSPDYIKLKWFLLDYTSELDFHATVIYTASLTPQMQKIFFKKVLMLIESKVLNISLDDLNKITTFNYLENEYAKEIDGVGLDFTLSIILKIATDLKNNEITSRNSIFEIIANQIKSPKDLLVIDGFFNECTGRTELDRKIEVKGKEQVIYFEKSKKDKFPRFATICDGRKAIDVNTRKPTLSRDGNFEFWWCENLPCFDICRKPVSTENWKNYSLQDVLRILNINYSNKQYEIVLSIINRVNRFLEHLTCKSCNSILRPNGRGNYGFYGVSMFSCINKECEKPDIDVYLSHCLNGQCEDIIDSRKSVKCRPSKLENPDNCGWYICNNCYACCDSEKLNARKNRLENMGQNYLCHTSGHRNLGVICCTKCGTETEEVPVNLELYSKQLEWFIKSVGTYAIENSGQRNDGKYWFMWRKGNLEEEVFNNVIESLRSNGFQIGVYDKYNQVQFVSEPYGNTNTDTNKFKCPNCKHIINLKNDLEFDFVRVRAVKKFHNTIFPDARNIL